MPSIILSDNGVSSGSAGLKSTAASDGALALQTTTSGGTATTAVTIDTSQNVGVGVTPSAWGSASRALQMQSGMSLFSNTSGLGGVGNNVYSNPGTGDYYIANGYATRYYQYNGTHVWNTAASGTAGNAITFTQAMTLDASGNLAVGTTSANGRLTIDSGSTSLMGSFNSTNANGGYFTLSTSGTVYGDIGTAFQAVSGSASDFAINARGARNLIFGTNNTERVRIESGGNVGIGVTPKSKTTIQGQLSIGQTGTASSAAGIYLYANDSLSDNSFLCRVSNGSGTTTWYIGNQAITTSSDIRLKENVKPSERNALDLLNQWEIIDHTWNDPSDQCENNRNSRGVWTGISAQQVQQVTPWLVNKPIEDVNEDGSINPWTMDFGYAVPLLVKAIQEQQAIIETLKARLDAANL